jgi:hypothetical protein
MRHHFNDYKLSKQHEVRCAIEKNFLFCKIPINHQPVKPGIRSNLKFLWIFIIILISFPSYICYACFSLLNNFSTKPTCKLIRIFTTTKREKYQAWEIITRNCAQPVKFFLIYSNEINSKLISFRNLLWLLLAYLVFCVGKVSRD